MRCGAPPRSRAGTDAGLIVERALTARLVDEATGEPGGLPLMSHVLLETWRRCRGRALTLAAYEAAGGIRGAIAQATEDLYTRLDPGQAAAARAILLRLVNPGEGVPDTRRPTGRGELGADGAGPSGHPRRLDGHPGARGADRGVAPAARLDRGGPAAAARPPAADGGRAGLALPGPRRGSPPPGRPARGRPGPARRRGGRPHRAGAGFPAGQRGRRGGGRGLPGEADPPMVRTGLGPARRPLPVRRHGQEGRAALYVDVMYG